jgi:hypothetical protein
MLTAERLRELLDYNPITGIFTWKVSRGGKAQAGAVAGSFNDSGYQVICVDRRRYGAHRLALLYVYGVLPTSVQVDHKNRKRGENRLGNLRPATVAQNVANRDVQRNNISGIKGVRLHRDGKWEARIMVDRKAIYLGLFKTPEEASAAYQVAARQHFGEFAACLTSLAPLPDLPADLSPTAS